MITSVKAVVDYENNAEEFWAAFREAVESLDQDSELAGNCCQILRRDYVELLDANAITEFQNFVCSLPGFSDGPEHAREAILFQAE